MNFSFNKEIQDTVKKQPYSVEIHSNNIITSAKYVEEYDCLDITYENPSKGYIYRDRTFNPTKSIPEWTTAEKELMKVQVKFKHVMRRFMSEEETMFEANTWKEMCEIVAEKLIEKSQGIEFDLKLIFDKNFEYPSLGLPRFIRVEGEQPLQYSKWEKENRLLPEIDTNAEVSAPSSSDIF